MSVDDATAGALVTSTSRDDRIDIICDAYEEAWLRGECPPIEEYLEDFSDEERPLLFLELLLLEIEYRKRSSETPLAAEYLTRFPRFGATVERAILLGDLVPDAPSQPTFPRRIGDATRRLGHFELLEEIGRGAAGTVWRAHDLKLQRIVAIKIPHSSASSSEELHRFLREGRAAAQVRHPNIVPIYDVGRDGDTIYLIAGFVDGPNLCKWLSGRKILAPRAVELCAVLAEALHHAHEQGVVHRDLKPANILLDHNEQPHITDFGLAKWAEDSHGMTLHGQVLGTPAYMSPEQARGDSARVDRQSDVFALGVILFELLTGHRPFEGEASAIVDAVINQAPPAMRTYGLSIPRDLETICLKALEKESRRRYTTAQEMAVDLRRFIRGESIIARRTGPIEKGWKEIRRRPAIAAMVMLGLTSISSLGAVGKLSRRNRELLGLHAVTLESEPNGATVAFIPLNMTTNEPIPEQAVVAQELTPVTLELMPGDYLVIATHGDRFHEVFRHVPESIHTVPAGYTSRRWKVDERRLIVLPKIKIPTNDSFNDMVKIAVPSHGNVHEFLVDADEFPVGHLRRINRGYPLSNRLYSKRADHDALTVPFDQAVSIAERVGKRLPTDSEYDCLFDFLSRRGGMKDGLDSSVESLQILNLAGGVAEWTQSSVAVTLHEKAPVPFEGQADKRIIRGGTYDTILKGSVSASTTSEDIRHVRVALHPNSYGPGLGFRCVRSLRPRFIDGIA